MKRRNFVRTAGTLIALGTIVQPFACKPPDYDKNKKKEEAKTDSSATLDKQAAQQIFTLPELPYAQNALEPHIDARTMGIHHGKHHAGYVKKLNAALATHALASKGSDLKAIVQSVTEEDGDIEVRNNGGGHFNHSLFWKIMRASDGTNPQVGGKLADAINSTFDSMEGFKTQFATAAATRFGSGWAWLSVDEAGKLFISSTPNQDNPLMKNLVEQAGTPLLGLDVWEHAYYLKYQNRRKEYIDNFFNLINWETVAQNYDAVG